MSEIKYFKNIHEYINYNIGDNQKIIVDKYISINPICDNIQQSLVFTLSNNTAYFLSNFEVLKDNEVLPKNQYSIKKIVYNGCEQKNKVLNLELISTNYTDSFSFNRNNYIELYVKGYKDDCNFQLKIKVVDFEEIELKEFIPKEDDSEKEEDIDDDFKKDMDLIFELFKEKTRHIKKSLEILKALKDKNTENNFSNII